MIDLICPICKDETEVDPAELAGVDVIECEECGAEFPFTLVDGALVLGPEVDGWTPSADDEEEVCDDCNLPIEECECDGEEDDDDEEIEIEDEDEDA